MKKTLYRKWKLVRMLKRYQKYSMLSHMTLPQIYRHVLQASKRLHFVVRTSGMSAKEFAQAGRNLADASARAMDAIEQFSEQSGVLENETD